MKRVLAGQIEATETAEGMQYVLPSRRRGARWTWVALIGFLLTASAGWLCLVAVYAGPFFAATETDSWRQTLLIRVVCIIFLALGPTVGSLASLGLAASIAWAEFLHPVYAQWVRRPLQDHDEIQLTSDVLQVVRHEGRSKPIEIVFAGRIRRLHVRTTLVFGLDMSVVTYDSGDDGASPSLLGGYKRAVATAVAEDLASRLGVELVMHEPKLD